MGLKNRVARLEKAGGGGTCCCPIEWVQVREGEPAAVEAEPPPPCRGDAAGRPVCGKCGLPLAPGQISRIEVRLARRNDDQADA